jgi:hypothetical protein
MEIRGLISASDAPRAWDLRCEVREKVLRWLSLNHPDALPRARVELTPESQVSDARPAWACGGLTQSGSGLSSL